MVENPIYSGEHKISINLQTLNLWQTVIAQSTIFGGHYNIFSYPVICVKHTDGISKNLKEDILHWNCNTVVCKIVQNGKKKYKLGRSSYGEKFELKRLTLLPIFARHICLAENLYINTIHLLLVNQNYPGFPIIEYASCAELNCQKMPRCLSLHCPFLRPSSSNCSVQFEA